MLFKEGSWPAGKFFSLSSKNALALSIATSRHFIPGWAFSLSLSFTLRLAFAKCSMPVAFGLPTCFLYTWNLSFVCQFAEANTADAIFSQICMRTSTNSAAAVFSCGEFLGTLLFDLHCCLSHEFTSFYLANGILNNLNNSRASSSVLAVVTKITSIPLTLSILSYSISGKMICSLIPSA